MNRKIGSVVLAVALTAGGAATAGAQARGYLGIGGGLELVTGDFKNDFGGKTGWLAQIAGGVTAPSGVLGGRISGTFARHGFEGTTDKFRILGAMADLVVSPKMNGKAGVYLLAGAGIQNGKATDDEGSSKFAWNAGAGVLVKAGSVGIFFEGRFLSINTEGSKTNLIPITVGVRLGGK